MGLREAAIVAGFDLRESLRSRKAPVLLVLYTGGAVTGAAIFVAVLRELENTLARQLGVAETDHPGALTQQLMQSEDFVDLFRGLVGDDQLARSLLDVP